MGLFAAQTGGYTVTTERLIKVSGARGESFADVARRVGAIGAVAVPSSASDSQVLVAMTDAVGANADTLAARDSAQAASLEAQAQAGLAEQLVLALGGTMYPDTATGLAATAIGDRFAVDNGDGTVTTWEHGPADTAINDLTIATTAALSSDGGAGMISFRRNDPDALQQSLDEILDGLPIAVQEFGAHGGVGNDDAVALQKAIDFAFLIGGARLVSRPGTVHYYSGRIKLRPGVRLDFGVNQQTDVLAPDGGPYLVATSADGGVDLVSGSTCIATLRTNNAAFVGPMLDINDQTSNELNFGRNERAAYFDVDIRGDRQPGSMGLRYYSGGAAFGGVSWTNGRAVVGEMDFSATYETAGDGYVNENWLELVAYAARRAIRSIQNGHEISANRITFTVQPDPGRAQRAIYWEGNGNFFNGKIWDWKAVNVDPAYGGTMIELSPDSAGNDFVVALGRSTGVGGGPRMPIVDFASRSSGKNSFRIIDGTTTEAVNQTRAMPASYFERTYAGDQDDSLAFANKRYTVTVAGTTPPDATSQDRLFDLSAANLNVNACVDFTVTIDMGVAPGGMMGMGVAFSVADRLPDKVKVEGSADNAAWSLILSAGYDNDPVPLHLFRDGGVGGFRYYRLTVVCNAPKQININRWWAADAGFTRMPGAFLPVYNPLVYGPLRINGGDGVQVQGTKVIGARGAAVANAVAAVGAPTQAEFNALVTQFNALLARVRAHGLIAP